METTKLINLNSGDVVNITKKRTLIGRAPACDIILNSSNIEEHHAFIFQKDKDLYLMDLNGENTCLVNGKSVKVKKLKTNDTITLGELDYILELGTFEDLETSIEPSLPPVPMESTPPLKIELSHSHYQLENKFQNLYQVAFDEESDIFSSDNIVKNFEISTNSEQAIQVHHTCQGQLINSKVYSITSENLIEKICMDFQIITKDDISINNNELIIHDKNGFKGKSANGDTVGAINLSTPNGSSINLFDNQIFFLKTDMPPRYINEPIHGRDTDYHKRLGKTLASVFILIFSLLMLGNPTPPLKQKKKIAIIYKMKKTQKAAAGVSSSEKPRPKKELNVPQNVTKAKTPKIKVTKQKKKNVKKLKTKKLVAKSKPTKAKRPKFKLKTRKLKSLTNTKVASSLKLNSNRAPASIFSQSKSKEFNTKSKGVKSFGSNYKGYLKNTLSESGAGDKKGFDIDYTTRKSVVKGSIDPELLRRLLRERLPQFRHCYQQELSVNTDQLKGTVDLRFRINANGSVSNIGIISNTSKFSNKGTNCMASVLKKINFPTPKGGGKVDVNQPLNFQAEQARI